MVVGEGGQKIMEDQVEVVGTLGEVVAMIDDKPEGEGVRIVEGKVVLV